MARDTPVTPKHYVPKHLSNRDKMRQKRELAKSRRLYKEKKYYTRRKLRSFKNKKSSHTAKAKAIYKVDTLSLIHI